MPLIRNIEAVDENGRTQEYICESHGFIQLTRSGTTPQMLAARQRLVVEFALSDPEHFTRDCSPEGVDGPIRKQEIQ